MRPSIYLVKTKIVKGESRDKQKTKFSCLDMPNRILSSKAVKDSERREQKKQTCLIFYAEPLSIFDVSQR